MTDVDIKEIITFSKQLGFVVVNDKFEKTKQNQIMCIIKFPNSDFYSALIDFTYNKGTYFDIVKLSKFNSFMHNENGVYKKLIIYR